MPSFVIDALPEHASRYGAEYAIVAVDVCRATTVILTGLSGGHDIYPVRSLAQARDKAIGLSRSLLVGEQEGVVPSGFDLDNSPAALSRLRNSRPIVLLTSAGTVLLASCQAAHAVYIASLRNLTATAQHVANQEKRVALLGAGTRGEPRPEDQLVCALIGRQLEDSGFTPETRDTVEELQRYQNSDVVHILQNSASGKWLRSVEKRDDLTFICSHVDDLPGVAVFEDGSARLLQSPPSLADRTLLNVAD